MSIVMRRPTSICGWSATPVPSIEPHTVVTLLLLGPLDRDAELVEAFHDPLFQHILTDAGVAGHLDRELDLRSCILFLEHFEEVGLEIVGLGDRQSR